MGCEEASPRSETPDIEVLAAEVFAAARGYDLGLDLAGADTYEIAYARITVTETTHGAGGSTDCAPRTGCDGTGEDPVSTVTTTEVYWDDIGSIWEAVATLDHEGLVDVKVETYDADGEATGTEKARLGAPWLDDGEGVSSLATDEDPLTSLALHELGRHYGATQHWHALTVVSEGWTAQREPGDACERPLLRCLLAGWRRRSGAGRRR